MSIHPQLERLIRDWAKEIKNSCDEVVFEASLHTDMAPLVAAKISSQNVVLFFFGSTHIGDFEILPQAHVEAAITSACDEQRMISFVNPMTGGGLTLDVSDEGNTALILQIAGWGSCASLVTELGTALPDAQWIPQHRE